MAVAVSAKFASKSRDYRRMKEWCGGVRTFWAVENGNLFGFETKKERDAFVAKMNRNVMGDKVIVTVYEEYPIYEPAEGGYYYSGSEATSWSEVVTMKQALEEIDEDIKQMEFDWHDESDGEMYIRYDNDDFIRTYRFEGHATIACVSSKRIGEGRRIVIEAEENFKCEEHGWHPYE